MKKIIAFIPIGLFLYSKFFYYSIINIGSLNFTLTDLVLGLMYLSVCYTIFLKNSLSSYQKSVLKIYENIFTLSICICIISSMGTIISGGNLLQNNLLFLKRWGLYAIVPMYIFLYGNKKQFKYLFYMIPILITAYYLKNIDQIALAKDTSRFVTDTMNPNVLGMFCSAILFIMLYFKNEQRNIYSKIISYLSIFLIVYLIIVSSSRGAIIPLIFTLIIYYIGYIKNKKLTYLDVAILFLTIAVVIVLFIFTSDDIVNILGESFTRLYNTIVEDRIIYDKSFIARIAAQVISLIAIISDFPAILFGFGFDGIGLYNATKKISFGVQTSDNQYVDVLSSTGLIGFTLMVSIIVKMLNRIKMLKNIEFNLYNSVVCVFIFISLAGITQSSFTEPTINSIFFILIGFSEICIKDRLS